MMNEYWMHYIAEMIEIKELRAKTDSQLAVKFDLPAAKAKEDDIRKAESILGVDLEPSYKAFLNHANGWKNVISDIDIFGTKELINYHLSKKKNKLIPIDDTLLSTAHYQKSDLIPVAIAHHRKEVFLLVKAHTETDHTIVHISKHKIDYFTNFEELFLYFIEYHK